MVASIQKLKKYLESVWKKFFPYDKLSHLTIFGLILFIISFKSAYLLAGELQSKIIALLAVIIISILKEILDAQADDNKFDWTDIAYAVAGGLLMFIIL